MNEGYTYGNRVPETASGQTVLAFYAQRYPHFPPERWRACIESGQVTLDGRPTHPDEPLAPGQHLAYHRPAWDEPDVPTDFDVLHADDALLVLAKPAGLPVLPGAGCLERSLLRLALRRLGGVHAPVHRIDRGTSGIVVFARTPEAARLMGIALRKRSWEKTYLTRVQGTGLPETFTIDQPIGRVPYPPLGVMNGVTASGKPSLTHATKRGEDAETTLLEVRIPTGRSQQIRIHLAWAGWPLVGEPLFVAGGLPRPATPGERAVSTGDCGFLLHAWKVAFCHPVTGAWLAFEAPPPNALRIG